MKYLVKRTKIDENTTEKLIIPVGDPPEIDNQGIEKYQLLKRSFLLNKEKQLKSGE